MGSESSESDGSINHGPVIPGLQATSDLTQSPVQNRSSSQSMTQLKYSSPQSSLQSSYASEDGHDRSPNACAVLVVKVTITFMKTVLKIMILSVLG